MYNNNKNCFRHSYHIQPEITVKTTDIVNEQPRFWLSKLCRKSAWKYLTVLFVCIVFVSLASQSAMAAVCPACNGTGYSRYSKFGMCYYSGSTPKKEYCSVCDSYGEFHTHGICTSCHGTKKAKEYNTNDYSITSYSGASYAGLNSSNGTVTDMGTYYDVVQNCPYCGIFSMHALISKTTRYAGCICTTCGVSQEYTW